MAGTPLAEAFVRVRALTDKFKDDVRDGLRGTGLDFGNYFGQEMAASLRAQRGTFEAEGREIGDEAGLAAGRAFADRMQDSAVKFGEDGAPFVRAGKQLGRESGDAAGREFADHMEEGAVRFGDDKSPFVRAGAKLGDETGAAFARAFTEAFKLDDNGRWHDARGRFVADAEAVGEETGEGFQRGVDRGAGNGNRDRGRRLGKDFGDGFADGLGAALKNLAPAFESVAVAMNKVLGTGSLWGGISAGVAGLGAAAASSAGYVVTLAADLAPLSGLLAGLPGVALVGAGAFLTWKLAVGGLGDAMKAALAGDDKKLGEALGRLSQGGRDFVTEFQQVIPQLQSFKAAAQDAFTEQLAGHLRPFIDGISGLKFSLSEIAAAFGGMTRLTLDWVSAAGTVEQLDKVLVNVRTLLDGVWEALRPLLQGFTDLGVVGSTWLAGMSGGLADVLTRFGEWMSQISAGGQALAWLNDATDVLKQLGGLVKDVWQVFTGLLKAAETAGGGALGVLGQLVDTFNRWVNSAQGQDVLVTVFKALNDVGRALMPVLTALGGAVAAIAPEAAKVATALGPVLADAIKTLGAGIAAMGPGLVAMVQGFGRMVENIGPLTPLGAALGDVFAALGGALALIVPQIAQIALALAPALTAAINALGPALAALGPGLTTVAQYLAIAFADPAMQAGLLALGKGISDVLIAAAPLLPIVAQLAGILAQGLAIAMSNLGAVLGPIVVALADALKPALAAISTALTQLAPLMPPIYQAFGEIAAAVLTQVLPPILNLIPSLLTGLVPAFVELWKATEPLLPILTDLAIKFINEILPAVLPMIPQLTDLGLVFAKIGIIAAQLAADLAPKITAIIGDFQRLTDRAGQIIGWFGNLPQMFATWLGQVVDWVENKWNLIKNAIADKIEDIKTKIRDTLDAIKQKWNDIWDGLKTFVSDKWNEIKTAVSGKVDDMMGTIRDIPGRITGALGNLGSLLWDSGRSVVQGLIDGLYSKLQDAANAASDILKRIRDFFPFSPAKRGPFSGRGWVLYSGESMMTALADGIRGQEGELVAAANQVMRAGADAFAPMLPGLSALAVPSPAPGFDGAFGAVTAGPAGGSAARGVHVENLVVNVQGIIDPNNPMSARRFAEAIREQIRQLDREVYQG
ncbi:hypothetical protein ACFYUV_11345 [Nonomuraea sp. NPDC003560]|uniref:phage tail protein n=1 Tax=Nonomuraea sp. NPDC003560 TaxID=3364341 RepID=UPI0036BFFAD1